jgi:plastocyanin
MMINLFQSILQFTLMIALLSGQQAYAVDVTVEVQDKKGKKLIDAVVYFENSKTVNQIDRAAIDVEQKGRQFNPLVSVVQTGTNIHFPNKDNVRHHVYSFSPAKKFELKLYSGVPANPVTFNKPGTVVIGCNIHDAMLAYIHIVDTPYFAKTDLTGVAKISNLPEGSYELKVWHYALQAENKPMQQSITINAHYQPVAIELDIDEAKLM